MFIWNMLFLYHTGTLAFNIMKHSKYFCAIILKCSLFPSISLTEGIFVFGHSINYRYIQTLIN